MKLSNILAPLLATGTATASALIPRQAESKPAYFVLAGDSTTAIGGGWGDGFLENTLLAPAAGINLGHSGATTVSFRAGGDWGTVLSEIKSHTATHKVFVTIQFGHNDQKEPTGITITDYANNLRAFAEEVTSALATPILVTPLTRRVFSGGAVVENLSNERTATIDVADGLGVGFIDLNQASTDYVNAIGGSAADAYNLAQGDRTHVNAWGGVVFGRMVSDLLVEKFEDVKAWTVANETLSGLIRDGVAA
jgi:lysophospholipase L1-like esterase